MTRVKAFGEHSSPIRRAVRALTRRMRGQRRPDWQPSAETRAGWDAIQAIPSSPLLGVIPVSTTIDASGVLVDLIAIELRERGSVLHWRARSSREVLLMSASVSVIDDRATQYRVIRGGGSGDSHAWEGQTFMVPSPLAGVQLSITLESFGPDERMPLRPGIANERISGPWEFDVPIPAT